MTKDNIELARIGLGADRSDPSFCIQEAGSSWYSNENARKIVHTWISYSDLKLGAIAIQALKAI